MILILFLWLCPEILKHLRNIPRHRFWCMLKSERVRRLTVFHHASCLGKNCRLKHLRWKHPEKTVQLEDDPFHFFQLLTLVLYPECWCSPCCFWSWSHSPWSHPLNKSTFSKFSRDQSIWSHIEDSDLGAFSFGGLSNVEICLPKSQPKKSLWRSMWRNFIEQRVFVGLPVYRTTKE